jgi:hypothetical protein
MPANSATVGVSDVCGLSRQVNAHLPDPQRLRNPGATESQRTQGGERQPIDQQETGS